MIGAIIAAAATVFSAGATYMAYEGQRKAASQAEDRARQELRIQRERIEYEANLAHEQAEWETKISLEKAEFTRERIAEEAALVSAAQAAGYAAAGLDIGEGSPLIVMARTAKQSEIEREAVLRGHEIFAETRAKEAEEVRKGGLQTYAWFAQRTHAEIETHRTQAKFAGYGKYLSTGATLLGGFARTAGAYSSWEQGSTMSTPGRTFNAVYTGEGSFSINP